MAKTDKAEEQSDANAQYDVKEGDERAPAAVRYKIINKVIPSQNGQVYRMLMGKSTAGPKRWIYLLRFDDKGQDSNSLSRPADNEQDAFSMLRSLDKEQDIFSLWNVKFVDDEDSNADFWPYNGTDKRNLLKEMLDYYIEHAFDDV